MHLLRLCWAKPMTSQQVRTERKKAHSTVNQEQRITQRPTSNIRKKANVGKDYSPQHCFTACGIKQGEPPGVTAAAGINVFKVALFD